MKKVNNYTPLSTPVSVTEQVWTDDTMPVVSVFNWVYNHKEYIRESIESILMQQTTFPIEIIIHDDASNDGTKEIILEYQEKYPRLFRNILQEENQWSQGKSVMAPLITAPRGNYIALTHGDDYWTDPLKLQKQVDFLENNSEYVLSFHPVQIKLPNGEITADNITNVPSYHEDFISLALHGNYIHTPSVIFKNIIRQFPPNINESPIGDYFLYMLLVQHGKIKRMDDVMAIYRFGVGVHSTKTKAKQKIDLIKTLKLLQQNINHPQVNEILHLRIARLRLETAPESIHYLATLSEIYSLKNLKYQISIFDSIKLLIFKIFRQ